MKSKIVILSLVLIGIVFISGCISKTQEVVCNRPYIKVGNSCCLDQNYNNICDNDEKTSQQPTIQEKTQLELTPNKLELSIKKGGWKVEYVTLKNLGDKEVTYAVMCNPPRFGGYFPGYEKHAENIPDHYLTTFIWCDHNDKWEDTIPALGTHSLDVTYPVMKIDTAGRHETKLVVAVKDTDYAIEIPLIINVVE